ncbi:ATP-binding protein [Flavobacterium sp.]|uniref:ATP-binding protein n=1 Tax=Flavobacterium sp. TaxID=239 RepID=UPI0037508185
MKKLLLILLTISITSFAQNKPYKQYRDFRVLLNIDSLQKIVDLQKDKSTLTYLHTLIELELGRSYFSDDLGKDLESIKTISLKKKDSLGLAIYYLLKSKLLFRIDYEMCLANALKANTYFERRNDTLGIILSNYYIILASQHPINAFENREKHVIRTFENILKYYNSTTVEKTKLNIIVIRMAFGHYLGKKVEEQLYYYKIGKEILDKHQEFRYLDYRFYTTSANVFYRLKEDKKGNNLSVVQRCYLKAYESLPPKPYYETVIALYNLGCSYMDSDEFILAKTYFKEAIRVYNQLKIDDPAMLSVIYENLSIIQYKQKDYKNAYESLEKENGIKKDLEKTTKSKEMQELQTKYETEKKDVVIKNLELQQQVTETRARLVLLILVLTCLIITAVSFIALRLRDANKSLKKLTQSRNMLFTIISHDLRSPFNSYQRYSEIVGYLIKTKQFDRLQEVLKKIDELGLNIAALLNNLLEWSVAQQKQIRIVPSVINIQVFFDEVLPIFRDMARLKKITILENFQDQEIKIDPDILSLIIRNLLDNAIKYTPEGNQITIQTNINEGDFVLTISNKGDSMTNTQREKIRTLFNNVNDYEFGEEGLGIGLILIKEFSRTNAVKIKFDHNADNLTTFEVRLSNV